MDNQTLLDFRAPDLRDFRQNLQAATREAETFGKTFASALSRSIVKGASLKSTIRSLALELSSSALRSSIKPIGNLFNSAIGNLLGGLAAAPAGSGTALPSAGIVPFAKGGVVSAPSYFPVGGRTGVMGEAGSEAILPLARDASGTLGVRAETGQRPVSVVFNVSTPDAASFRRSETEISSMLARSVQRGRRGL